MLSDRRRVLLAVLVVVALGAVWWNFQDGSAAPGPAPAAGPARRPAASAGAVEQLPAAESVRLSSLPQERGEPEAAVRNPFRFERRTPPPATAPAQTAPVFAPPAVTEKPAGLANAGVAPIALKFIGVMQQGGGVVWAVLTSGDGQTPLHGKEGDIIDGRYRILKIGNESIELAYLDGRGRQTIKLTGQ